MMDKSLFYREFLHARFLSTRPRNMKAQLVLGIMSGTSIDSVDYALCAISQDPSAPHPSRRASREARISPCLGISIRLKKHWQMKFPRSLQLRLHQVARGAATS